MLKVPVNEKYRITSDAHNFIIQEFRGNHCKQPWASIKFYPNIDSLLWGLFNLTIRVSSAETQGDLRETVLEAKRQIDTIRAAVLSSEATNA